MPRPSCFDAQLSALQIGEIHVGDLEFAARRRFERRRDVDDLVVVEVETDDGVVRARLLRLLLDREHVALRVELDDAVALRVAHPVAEDRRALVSRRGALEAVAEAVAVEEVVAERQRDAVAADEIAPDQERLRDAFGRGCAA